MCTSERYTLEGRVDIPRKRVGYLGLWFLSFFTGQGRKLLFSKVAWLLEMKVINTLSKHCQEIYKPLFLWLSFMVISEWL